MPPKSEKLKREEAANDSVTGVISLATPDPPRPEGPIQVRKVDCCNDFVAILVTQVHSSIDIPNSDYKYKNEGLVVGVGPGMSDGAGGRLLPQVDIGDYVMYGERNVIQKIESDSPPYIGQVVVIVSEKNIICKLPTIIEWVEYEGE